MIIWVKTELTIKSKIIIIIKKKLNENVIFDASQVKKREVSAAACNEQTQIYG